VIDPETMDRPDDGVAKPFGTGPARAKSDRRENGAAPDRDESPEPAEDAVDQAADGAAARSCSAVRRDNWRSSVVIGLISGHPLRPP